jgi:hypothetical protein
MTTFHGQEGATEKSSATPYETIARVHRHEARLQLEHVTWGYAARLTS